MKTMLYSQCATHFGRTFATLFVLLAGLLTGIPLFGGESDSASSDQVLVYVGTYTGAKSQGIYAFRLNPATGDLSPMGLAAKAQNPSFLALDPSNRFLYAANETEDFGGRKSGAVSAFALDRQTGRLTFLNQEPSGGGGPCHVSVSKSGKFVLVANYGGGSISVLPAGSDGRLGKATAFIQHEKSGGGKRPHAHSINLDAANRFALVADLGLDKVFIYRFDSDKGTLVPNQPPAAAVKPGAGPRHFAFHPKGNFAYVINELQSTVTAFTYEAGRGALKEIQTVSTLPEDFKGENSTAEVQVHPSGKFLYGSNRGHDSIAVFAIEEKTGKLKLLQYQSTQGKTPRNFGIDPTGCFLIAANQDSDSLVVFRIDPSTGLLKATGHVVQVGSPVCVKFVQTK